MKRPFFPPESFELAESKGQYSLLPFRFLRLDARRELLVNEAGEFIIGPIGTSRALVGRQLDLDSDLYRELRAKHFLYTTGSSALLDILAAKYRSKRAHLFSFTQLHMFVVTLRCEHSCQYCQVSRQAADRDEYDMSVDSATKSLDLMFKSTATDLVLEFQGGESLLNFEIVKYIVESAEARAVATGKRVRNVVATNLSLLNDEHLAFFREHDVYLSISLDGPAHLHNTNRPRAGANSHQLVEKNLAIARAALGYDKISALMTTTRLSTDYPEEIIDEYVRLKFLSVFLRKLNPYGFADRSKNKTGYTADTFIHFYQRAIEHVLKLNKGGTKFVEILTKLLLTKILTPFSTRFVDLQSPNGAGIKAVSYNYNGDVYASDESRMLAEMDDHSFRLGNVHANTYEEIFGGPTLRRIVATSTVEGLPGCADCALQVYCGGDPVYNHFSTGDMVGHRPSSHFCKINTAVMKYLFQLIASGDESVMKIFLTWLRDEPESSSSSEVWL